MRALLSFVFRPVLEIDTMKIEIQNITKHFRNKQVLSGASFSAVSGQCIGILGSNGCGKSTLLSILAGVLPCDSGAFLYEGKDLFAFRRQRAELVGYVPQGTPLIEELTTYDNLLLWYDKKQLTQELQNGVLKMLGVGDFLKVPVSKLSGGMKKRLSIGCAIAKHPPILLLDEPMAALDFVCKQQISQYLTEHKQKGGILILVTHDVQELALCDTCYILKGGVLAPYDYTGNIDELVEKL